MKNQTNTRNQKLVFCSDICFNSVVVDEDHQGDAYCSDCMTDERLKETDPELYETVQKELARFEKYTA